VWQSDKVSFLGARKGVSFPPALPPADRGRRIRLWCEIAIVLALSVGRSAVSSVLSLIQALQSEVALGDQQTSLNPGASAAEFWDVLGQFLSQLFAFAPIALVILLLWEPGQAAFRRIGLDFRRFGGDVGRAVALLAVIGIPGLGLYALGRALGITRLVDTAPLDPSVWTIPLLLLAAVRAGLTEEVIFLGYLFDRLRRLGWGWWWIIAATALLRGAYHAYQGFGSIVGNVAMGLVFGWCYRRWGRVMPLVIAHTLIDVIAFVGYPLAAAWWPGLFAPAPAPTPSP
jgi:membrane protease YdiL (CAAX protease family)